MSTNTRSIVIPKRIFQKLVRQLRANGFTVTRLDAGYECIARDGTFIMKAMNGHHGYLTRYNTDAIQLG